MGIDYDANFGLGYEVEASDRLTDDELEEGLLNYIDSEISEGFECFSVGSDYSGDTSEYVVFKEEIDEGFDFNESKKDIEKELKRMKLEPIGKFGITGGLLVW